MITAVGAYEESIPKKGYRLLVDRLWPRGILKDKLELDRWMKEIAPSDELKKWYAHLPDRWNEFRSRYFKELDKNPLTQELLEICRSRDTIFLYSSKVKDINNAAALKEYVEGHL